MSTDVQRMKLNDQLLVLPWKPSKLVCMLNIPIPLEPSPLNLLYAHALYADSLYADAGAGCGTCRRVPVLHFALVPAPHCWPEQLDPPPNSILLPGLAGIGRVGWGSRRQIRQPPELAAA